MQRSYILGEDNNEITLEVTIGTTAIANTVVARHRSGGEKSIIGESDVDSGNIASQQIGTASQFKDSVLVIVTLLNISRPSEFDAILDRLVTRYKISGGFSGTQVYNHDLDDIISSPNKSIIVVSKAIKFIDKTIV